MAATEPHPQELRYNVKKNELILTHCGLRTLTTDVIEAFGQCTEYLDLSHNRITNLQWLYAFERLRCLVLDNNRLQEAQLQQLRQPLLHVQLLMLNRNELMDLEKSIELLSRVFPNLEYLSLHGNPICPDGLELQPFSQYVSYEYEFYRTYILRAFDKLKFLDHYDLRRMYVYAVMPEKNAKFLTFTPKILWTRFKGTLPLDNPQPLRSGPHRFVGYHFGTIRRMNTKDLTCNDVNSEGNIYISNKDL